LNGFFNGCIREEDTKIIICDADLADDLYGENNE
jgi:hypothetical protein